MSDNLPHMDYRQHRRARRVPLMATKKYIMIISLTEPSDLLLLTVTAQYFSRALSIA